MNDHVRFPIEGMTCTSCASGITRAVRKLEGVDSVKVDFGSDSCAVSFDPARTSLPQIAAAVSRAGYVARIDDVESIAPTEPRSLRATLGLGR
jgi:Cu+-exporting ATPase